MPQKIAFIINPVSGKGSRKSISDIIYQHLDKEVFSPELYFTERRNHATEITENLLQRGVEKIVAVGGDGTVNEVAKTLMHTQAILGIIPAGSGNGLARHLCIPLEPGKAVQLLNKNYSIKMDVGFMNDVPFFCTSGVGFDAYIGDKFSRKSKRGFQTYVKTAVLEFLHYTPHDYIIEYAREKISTRAFLITIGNTSQYGNNALICPYADVQDGLLDVSIIVPFAKIFAFDLGRRLFNGTIDRSRYTTSFKTEGLKITRKEKGAVHIDGEPLEMGQELLLRVKPASLNVLVNPKK